MADHVNLRAIIATGPDEVTFTFAAERPLRSVAVAGTFNSWLGADGDIQASRGLQRQRG